MSYFSNLSVEITEHEDRDRSYPSPIMQLHFLLEDLIAKYLAHGGTKQKVKYTLRMPIKPVSLEDNQLLYSSEFLMSPAQIIRCIQIAWCKIWACSELSAREYWVLNELADNLLSPEEQVCCRKKAVA